MKIYLIGDIVGYNAKANRYCKKAVNGYTTLSSATAACSLDDKCGGVYDYCGGISNEFWACPPPFKEEVSTCGSILYVKRKYLVKYQKFMHLQYVMKKDYIREKIISKLFVMYRKTYRILCLDAKRCRM